jgi:hypothetical protein
MHRRVQPPPRQERDEGKDRAANVGKGKKKGLIKHASRKNHGNG